MRTKFFVAWGVGAAAVGTVNRPFAFTGKLDKLIVRIDRSQLPPGDTQKLEAAGRNNHVSD